MQQTEAQGQANGDTPRVYTMRQLNQQTAYVMDQIGKDGPALITRLGRFVAMIAPLRRDVESRVLTEMAREIGKQELGASSQLNDDKPDVYTMRQLGQQTAYVMTQIGNDGPALITRHGHFVAMITPLRGDVESRVLTEMAREIGKRDPGTSSQASA
jgi:antitoxin (DNA-binding transcriptional repressor) of toxin-antitoxin stability system